MPDSATLEIVFRGESDRQGSTPTVSNGGAPTRPSGNSVWAGGMPSASPTTPAQSGRGTALGKATGIVSGAMAFAGSTLDIWSNYQTAINAARAQALADNNALAKEAAITRA